MGRLRCAGAEVGRGGGGATQRTISAAGGRSTLACAVAKTATPMAVLWAIVLAKAPQIDRLALLFDSSKRVSTASPEWWSSNLSYAYPSWNSVRVTVS